MRPRSEKTTPLRHRFLLIGLLASSLAFAGPAAATVMVEVALEDMVRDSQGIVRAHVVDSGVQMQLRAGGYEPTTITTLRVDEWIVGSGPRTIRLREIGGVHARGGRRIDGTPTYRPGAEVIVALDSDADGIDSYFRTYGLAQGKWLVFRDAQVPTVRRDLGGVAFAAWTAGMMTMNHRGANITTLQAFLDRVWDIGELDGRPTSRGSSTSSVTGGVR